MGAPLVMLFFNALYDVRFTVHSVVLVITQISSGRVVDCRRVFAQWTKRMLLVFNYAVICRRNSALTGNT